MPFEFNPASFQISDTIDLVDASDKDLRAQAKLFNVHGRSKMNKARLLKTINDLQCQICDFHLDKKDTEQPTTDEPTTDSKPTRQKSKALSDAVVAEMCLTGNKMLASGSGWKQVYSRYSDLGISDPTIHNLVTGISRQKITMQIRAAFLNGTSDELEATDEPQHGTEIVIASCYDDQLAEIMELNGFTSDWHSRDFTVWSTEAQLTEQQCHELKALIAADLFDFTVN